jgi:hypothetical protein
VFVKESYRVWTSKTIQNTSHSDNVFHCNTGCWARKYVTYQGYLWVP